LLLGFDHKTSSGLLVTQVPSGYEHRHVFERVFCKRKNILKLHKNNLRGESQTSATVGHHIKVAFEPKVFWEISAVPGRKRLAALSDPPRFLVKSAYIDMERS
jgi:hypothetical protein